MNGLELLQLAHNIIMSKGVDSHGSDQISSSMPVLLDRITCINSVVSAADLDPKHLPTHITVRGS
jgi:hypothetical protein